MSDNEQKAQAIIEASMPHLWMIKEALDRTNMVEVDLIRALYLIENIQKISQYGKVTITVKAGEVISVAGENTFISEAELRRNLQNNTPVV